MKIILKGDEVNLLKYSVMSIFDREALKQGRGRFDEKGLLRLTFEDLGEINKSIVERKFPDEYYKLCDKLGYCYEQY